MERGEKASAKGGGFSRNEGPSRRKGRYTRMTASKRSSKGAERYLCRGKTESNGGIMGCSRVTQFYQDRDFHCLSLFLSLSLSLSVCWHVKDEHVKNAAQDVAQNVTQDVAEDVLGSAQE